MKVSVKFECQRFSFSFDGPEQFLDSRMQSFIAELVELSKSIEEGEASQNVTAASSSSVSKMNLPQFLGSQTENTQVTKFLATAAWLQTNGLSELTTTEVSEALLKCKQKKLPNPADCLNKNVANGNCEKVALGSRNFYVTPQGLAKVGLKSI